MGRLLKDEPPPAPYWNGLRHTRQSGEDCQDPRLQNSRQAALAFGPFGLLLDRMGTEELSDAK